jgi:hypothetical protein
MYQKVFSDYDEFKRLSQTDVVGSILSTTKTMPNFYGDAEK